LAFFTIATKSEDVATHHTFNSYSFLVERYCNFQINGADSFFSKVPIVVFAGDGCLRFCYVLQKIIKITFIFCGALQLGFNAYLRAG